MTAREKKILIVEDEPKIASLLADYLQSQGSFHTHAVHRGDLAMDAFGKFAPDLVLLDLMLPGMDGIEVCKKLRAVSEVPIIMVTARVEEIDRLLGLELGADDYICKPFSPREVVARVKAVLRRVYAEPERDNLIIGSISLNDETHQVMIDKQEINLTPSEFGLLKGIMAHPNRVFTR